MLPRAVGLSKAAEMAFTGDAIDAADALAARIAANPGPALRMAKRLMREGQHTRLDSLLELSAAF